MDTEIQAKSVKDITNSRDAKESSIIEETNITLPAKKSASSYITQKLEEFCEAENTDVKRGTIRSGIKKCLAITRGPINIDFSTQYFRNVNVDGEWLFVFLHNNVVLAYKGHKEMWRFDFDNYVIRHSPKFVCGSDGEIVVYNYVNVTILRNGHIIRYFVWYDEEIISVIAICEGLLLILHQRYLNANTYHLTIISKEGENLYTQSVQPMRNIFSFNGGILALYKPVSGGEYSLKWYKEKPRQSQCGPQYILHYSTLVGWEDPDLTIHNNTVMVTRKNTIIFLNDQLQKVTEIYCGVAMKSIVYNNKVILCYKRDPKFSTVRVISIPYSPLKLESEARLTTYEAQFNSSDLLQIFEYMDSTFIVNSKCIYSLTTRWSKRNNSLQSKKNKDAIKTLYAIQHYGSFHAPREILEFIVTLAFSTML